MSEREERERGGERVGERGERERGRRERGREERSSVISAAGTCAFPSHFCR